MSREALGHATKDGSTLTGRNESAHRREILRSPVGVNRLTAEKFYAHRREISCSPVRKNQLPAARENQAINLHYTYTY
jgi:hypothetical protein